MTHPTLVELQQHAQTLRAIRQDLHQHPELAYEEKRTADIVARKLKEWGFEVTTGVGGTGVVGTLKAGNGERAMAIRADMDALPMTEQTGLPYSSVHAGTMHACGHDGHTATLLGAALYLGTTRRFDGTLHLYFQPAEETGHDSGAQRMIADGLFTRFPCDAVFGLHNHPGEPAGRFLFRTGAFMSASDKIIIEVHGRGGHAARPHLAADPVVAASSIVLALQTAVSRNVDPLRTGIVTVGVIKGGVANNVIPESVRLELSVRSFDPATQQLLRERIQAIAISQAESYGTRAEVTILEGYPVLINTDAETAFATEVARELFGEDCLVADYPPVTASEDFAYMLQQRPGCFLRLGNGTGPASYPVHHGKYDFNDDNLVLGASFWSRLVERYLSTGPISISSREKS
ncbi:M20 aminoacylase family protein [Bordetella sp. N]|uniref:M20 aminoacylase family protein n=1 Tax=Bordetella sp. N TaxID=1746199 RepID=UPI00070F6608|nr:M20 aminoacylase family protein [Bordetella sp. N]ALM86004.1 amidohydrolase [Bordetella sp. N]